MRLSFIKAIAESEKLTPQEKINALEDIAQMACNEEYGNKLDFLPQGNPYLHGAFVWERSDLGYDFWKYVDQQIVYH